MNNDWDDDFEIAMERLCRFWDDIDRQSEEIVCDIVEKVEAMPEEQFICMKTRFCKMVNDTISDLSNDDYEDAMSDEDINQAWDKLTHMTAKTIKKNLEGSPYKNWTRYDFNLIIREKLFKSYHYIPLETLWLLQDKFQSLYKKTLPKEVKDLSVETTSKPKMIRNK